MNTPKCEFSRRAFLARVPAIGMASAVPLIFSRSALCEDAQGSAPTRKKPDKGPRLDLGLVQEFVGVAHRDLGKVKELLGKHPTLLNAAHDWGGGDWETALGAAAHTGRRNIAMFLLENHARVDVFAAAMLGRLDFVKAAVEAFPETIAAPGPHGIPLIKHAEAGGAEAAQVLSYLRSIDKT